MNQIMKPVNTPEKIDSMNRLPQELVVRIFGFLKPVELWYASQVCRSWRDAASDNSIWKAFIDFSNKNVDEKAKEFGSFKQFFITNLEYRKLDYFISDKRGFYTAQAYEYFETIRSRGWSKWEQEKYHCNFEEIYKDHEWITQVLDTVCRVSYFESNGIDIAMNDPDDYVDAFNYLYEHNALNEATITCINACVDDESLSEQFHIQYYVHFVVLLYRASLLNDENLLPIKRSVDPDHLFAEAFGKLLDALKREMDVQKKQIMFAHYRDRLLVLSQTCETSSLKTYAECMVNLYTHGIVLSNPGHVVIYDELLKFKATKAWSYSYDFIKLHSVNLLIESGCKLLRDLILRNPYREGAWRAEDFILNYVNRSLRPYVERELNKLTIDPKTVTEALKELEELPVDLKMVRKAIEELGKFGIELNRVREKLKQLNESEESDTDSGIGAVEDNNSPSSSFLSELDPVIDNTPSPTATQTQSDPEPLKQFKISLSKLVNQNNAARILHALQTQDAQSFETIQGFLLNNYILRDFFLNKNCGVAAIAELYGNKHLAFFTRLVAALDKLLYENDHSLIKRLPDDDRTQAADKYLHAIYRSDVSSTIGDYLQKTTPNKDDKKMLSKALEKAMERFCYNTENLLKENSAVRSLAQDRTWQSQMRRRVMMVIVNVALVLSVFGIAAIIYRHCKYGCTFFGATHSKQTLYHMKKKVLHDVTEFSSQQSKASLAA